MGDGRGEIASPPLVLAQEDDREEEYLVSDKAGDDGAIRRGQD